MGTANAFCTPNTAEIHSAGMKRLIRYPTDANSANKGRIFFMPRSNTVSASSSSLIFFRKSEKDAVFAGCAAAQQDAAGAAAQQVAAGVGVQQEAAGAG